MLVILMSCDKKQKPTGKKPNHAVSQSTATSGKERKKIQYSDQELEAYLDSIGNLSTQPLADKAAFWADSVFKSQKQLDTLISVKDFELLKRAAHKGVIGVEMARRIFRNQEISFGCTTKSIFLTYKKGLIPVVYYPFDKNKNDFNEFAICVGDPGHCSNAYFYFFKSNRIIARHDGYNRFTQEPEHYKDEDGKTIVYTVQGFDNGSGIWWNNFFFYKYEGDKLIPILNELQNGNMQSFWGFRVLWLESFIQKTNPLTIKMVYYNQFADEDSDKGGYGPLIINDSTIVQYNWDERTKTLQGQYDKSKISKPQILSYYLGENDLLFMNTHYSTLKNALRDKTKMKLLLVYLNNVKNYYNRH